MNNDLLLDLRDLKTYFFTSDGVAKAVDGVSYQLHRGETLGVVGESGCGKSVTALSILRLVPDPPGRTVGGEILFEGSDLLKLSRAEMRRIRGNRVASVDPKTMAIKEYTLPDAAARPRRIALTSDDVVWYTDFARGYLGRFDPKTGAIKEWASPGGPKSQPYGIATEKDIVWYSESAVTPNTQRLLVSLEATGAARYLPSRETTWQATQSISSVP